MNCFVNLNKLADYVSSMVTGLMVKRWKILIAPEHCYFWTSDNPGFSIFINEYEKTGKCFPSGYIEVFSSDSVHYYPLTQKFCLELGPFMEGNSVETNFSNDEISFETLTRGVCEQINIWSSLTACDFIVMDKTVIE